MAAFFYDNHEALFLRKPELFANGLRIFNLDETSTKTVQTPNRIFAGKGSRRVSQNTSAEKGTLVTTCMIVNGAGQVFPPVMVFPRVNFKPSMLTDCFPGTRGLAEKSGWMTSKLFGEVMRHFISVTGSSEQRKHPGLR